MDRRRWRSPQVLLAAVAVLAAALLVFVLHRKYEPPTFHERATLRGHTRTVECLAFSPDGKVLASAAEQGPIRVWDVASGELSRTLAAHKPTTALAFSPDGKLLASAGGAKAIDLWDTQTWGRSRTLTGCRQAVHCLAFSPDGATLASGGVNWSPDRTLSLWDVAAGRARQVLPEPEDEGPEPTKIDADLGHFAYCASSVAFSPDGRFLASVYEGHLYCALKLWDARTGQLRRTIDECCRQVAFTPDGERVAAGCDDGKVRFWGARSGEPQGELAAHVRSVTSLAFSPDGRVLATKAWDPTKRREETIALWDMHTGRLLRRMNVPGSGGGPLAFAPDGKTLATASGDTITLWAVTGAGK